MNDDDARRENYPTVSQKFVVIVGEMFGKKTIFGPFADMDHVNQWVSVNVGNQKYEFVPLLLPQ